MEADLEVLVRRLEDLNRWEVLLNNTEIPEDSPPEFTFLDSKAIAEIHADKRETILRIASWKPGEIQAPKQGTESRRSTPVGEVKPKSQFISLAEAGEIAVISKDTIRNMIERGDLPCYRPVRGRILIDRDELMTAIRDTRNRTVRRGRGQGKRPWTNEEVSLLGRMSDDAVAEKTGRRVYLVFQKRLSLRIPQFGEPGEVGDVEKVTRRFSRWNEHEKSLLGNMRDAEVAKETGRSLNSVVSMRSAMGIKEFISKVIKAPKTE